MTNTFAQQLATDLHHELTQNILPFWMVRMVDNENGGFYGQIDGNNTVNALAPKGGILNARILWTFSAAYRQLGDSQYLDIAIRARDYILNHFIDREHGGTYWSLDHRGFPLDTKKQIYSQAFFIYALTEFFLATGDGQCLEEAIKIYRLIEQYSFDVSGSGYLEAYSRDWHLLDDLRLSAKDANEKKTMNTHLHILEAYTNLYRVWKDNDLRNQLRNLIYLFTDRIIDPQTSHLNLFFNEDWICRSTITSYGHDIECSWLLYEAANLLGDEMLTGKVKQICLSIVNAASEGLQPDGSIINERNNATGHTDADRHWWPQAEAVVGFYNAFELTCKDHYLTKALNAYAYIQQHLVDKANGEWYWSIRADGSVNRHDDKAGFWKCPYHNGRMCLEIIARVG
ncbi:MAG: AGE family epimerase/isomerase [Tenuifilaceae bacterium]|nr:AGE family epimerase/isomerase [Tenuifilaceae bacterium]